MLEDGFFLISDFDSGSYNQLGGGFEAVVDADALSQGTAALDRGQGLHFAWKRDADSGPRLAIRLFDERAAIEDRTYLHAGQARFLSVEIRGSVGGEALSLWASDRLQHQRQESMRIGELGLFLPRGEVTKAWQRALVPLSALPMGLDREELAVLFFSADAPAAGSVHLRNLALRGATAALH
jgi:hypothetical protein